jgi:hypothetical protein
MQLSLKDQFENINNEHYPFVRRDKHVRARIIAETPEGDILAETVAPRQEPTRRIIARDYWENNYWEGKS